MSAGALAGVRIAVTRAERQAGGLASLLRAQGADVVQTPLIRIEARLDAAATAELVADLRADDWLAFSSANGVRLFCAALAARGAEPIGLRVACVGPATAAAARAAGLEPDLVPPEYTAAALGEALGRKLSGAASRVLVIRAEGGRPELVEHLKRAGAAVTDVALYRSVLDEHGAGALRERIAAGELDVLSFTSGSTIRYFAEAVGRTGGALVAVIGPVTAQIARQYGLHVAIEADPHTAEGLAYGIRKHFERARRRATEE